MSGGAGKWVSPRRNRLLSSAFAVPAFFALAKLFVHLLANRQYGYFRDELYYIACSDHLAFGYVDHPPLSIAILKLSRLLIGDSLPALRFLPALAGAAVVFLAGLMARELGGGRYAQALACTAALIAPMYLGVNNYFSMNSFDFLFWSLAFYLLIRILASPDGTGAPAVLWLLLGAVLGLGLLNKISVLWLAFGLAAGLVLTPMRRWLLSPWPWTTGAIAAALFSPHILWQIQNSWPTIEFMRNATGFKMAEVSPLEFIGSQLLVMNPLNALVWLAGLGWVLFHREGRRWRLLGVIWLSVFLLLIVNGKSRSEYLAPAYPPLLAAGAVAIEAFLRKRAVWLRPALVSILLAGGAVLAPLALPVLPVETLISYSRLLGIKPGTEERKAVGELPQHYADMFGWEEMAAGVARAWLGLPESERVRTGIYAQNYGEAGAVDFFGGAYGLPKAMCGHNNYWLWGPGGREVRNCVILGGRREDHLKAFETVDQAGAVECRRCMPYERNLPVWIGRNLKVSVAEIWPRNKHYD